MRWCAWLSVLAGVLAEVPSPQDAVAACPAKAAAAAAAADEEPPSLALLQLASNSKGSRRSSGEGALVGRYAALARFSAVAAGVLQQYPTANCSTHPGLCTPATRCDTEPVSAEEETQLALQLATKDGHANLRSWCYSPDFADIILRHCIIDHNLKLSAQLTYEYQVAHGIDEYDGSYCFIEGYCDDEEVTYNTTLEEAEALCDTRYPGWKTIGFRDIEQWKMAIRTLLYPQGGLPPAVSHLYANAACAMGNYHCDAVYCKETYCKMEHYQQRYGHYLKGATGKHSK